MDLPRPTSQALEKAQPENQTKKDQSLIAQTPPVDPKGADENGIATKKVIAKGSVEFPLNYTARKIERKSSKENEGGTKKTKEEKNAEHPPGHAYCTKAKTKKVDSLEKIKEMNKMNVGKIADPLRAQAPCKKPKVEKTEYSEKIIERSFSVETTADIGVGRALSRLPRIEPEKARGTETNNMAFENTVTTPQTRTPPIKLKIEKKDHSENGVIKKTVFTEAIKTPLSTPLRTPKAGGTSGDKVAAVEKTETKFENSIDMHTTEPAREGVQKTTENKSAVEVLKQGSEMASDRITVLEQSTRNRHERAPRTPIEKLDNQHRVLRTALEELEKEDWYHGLIPIEDVKTILLQDGDFLVRKTGQEIKTNPPVLTVMWNAILHHFPLYAVQRKKANPPEFTIDMVIFCETYTSLVKRHWKEKKPVFHDVVLITAAARQSWELNKDDVTMEKKIGEGQYGEVWKGRLRVRTDDKINTVIVAIKSMKLNAKTHEQLEMFHREARLMRMYDHRNVVKLHGLVFSEDDVMVVMELVSGGGLDTYLKQKKLMPLVKASFCYDVAAGLAYLHGNNCMHRDVAARNCLVTTDGRLIKLSDFGMAAHGRYIKLTAADRVPIRWQAPEVLLHHIYMRESDVWSYGMVISEIYNEGKVPFHNKSIAEIRSKIHDPEFRPRIPNFVGYPEVPRLMHQCWEIDVTKRPTMYDVSMQLKRYCIHTVKEKAEAHPDSAQKFIDRIKIQGYTETITVGSRAGTHKPPFRQIVASTTTPIVGKQKTKTPGKEMHPAVAEGTEEGRVETGQRLKPFIPKIRSGEKLQKTKTEDEDRVSILQKQPPSVVAQLRYIQQLRKKNVKNDLEKE